MIQSVFVDLENLQVFIHGENFDNGAYPVVTLGGIKVDVETYSRNEIVATLPPNLPDSDYRLVVSTGHDAKCNDKYSLTIGAQGPQGPPGIIGWVIVSNPGSVNSDGNIEGIADCPVGLKVIGGGFSCSTQTRIFASMPLQDGSGWYAIGTLASGESLALTIYAVCAQVQ